MKGKVFKWAWVRWRQFGGYLYCVNVITFTFLLLVLSFIVGYLQYLIRGRLTWKCSCNKYSNVNRTFTSSQDNSSTIWYLFQFNWYLFQLISFQLISTSIDIRRPFQWCFNWYWYWYPFNWFDIRHILQLNLDVSSSDFCFLLRPEKSAVKESLAF